MPATTETHPRQPQENDNVALAIAWSTQQVTIYTRAAHPATRTDLSIPISSPAADEAPGTHTNSEWESVGTCDLDEFPAIDLQTTNFIRDGDTLWVYAAQIQSTTGTLVLP